MLERSYHNRENRGRGGENGVTIEEVDEDHHGNRNYRAQEPIVEEPDDANPRHREQRRRGEPPARGAGGFGGDMFGGNFGFGGGGGGSGGTTVFSYSSSSMHSGGPGGVTYSSSTTHRRGPGGVSETHHSSYNGRTGEETLRIQRGLGDKSRTIERRRNAAGQEYATDNLNNISDAEASRFDDEWKQHAQRSLPRTSVRHGGGSYLASGYGDEAYPSAGRARRGGYALRDGRA